jgi:hypothetical protein
MRKDVFVIGDRAFSWRELCELRRQQEEARKAAQPKQLTLFELRDDCRPAIERGLPTATRSPRSSIRSLRCSPLPGAAVRHAGEAMGPVKPR